MSVIRFEKVVSALPGTLTPDTLYMVRVGAGFDFYVSDSTGSVAHQINGSAVNLPTTVTQAEAEAGTLTEERTFTPQRVAQAIAALAQGSSDILVYASYVAFPATGTVGKLYLAENSGSLYAWIGSSYVNLTELASHTHNISDVIGLQSNLDSKAALTGAAFSGDVSSTGVITATIGMVSNGDFFGYGQGYFDNVLSVNNHVNLASGSSYLINGAQHTHVKANITDFNDADYATAAQGIKADTAYSWGDHADLYLPISGGALTGPLSISSSAVETLFTLNNTDGSHAWSFKVGEPGNYDGYLMIGRGDFATPGDFYITSYGAPAFANGIQLGDDKSISSASSGSLAFIELFDTTNVNRTAQFSFRNSNFSDPALQFDAHRWNGSSWVNSPIMKLSFDGSSNTVDVLGDITVSGTVDGRDVAADGALLDTALQPADIVNSTNWDTAYSWGNHASAGYVLFSSLAAVATTGAYSDLTGIPSTFAPSAHTHTKADVTDFPTVVSQAEAESGTATTERLWTAQRVAQAITALGGGGGGGGSIDSGTSAERPASPLAPMLFYNTSLNGLELYYPNIDTWEVISTFTSQVDPTSDSGQALYTAPGTHTWICPANVYQVDVVCVGGGGSGAFRGRGGGSGSGGGGGGLGYANSISVTPGQSYTVVVGPGGAPIGTPYYGGVGNNGGNSYFISTGTVLGGGGKGGSRATLYVGGVGGSYFPLGGNGGNGGDSGVYRSAGGGGAGGYSGSGGAGGTATQGGVAGAAGTGGGGGGGGEGDYTYRGGGGGGVGLLGEGTSGTGGAGSATSHGTPGAGGSGGANGANSAGGAYGGGGAGGNYNTAGGSGTDGAVRIIWGPGRAFPSTNTGDV